MQRINAILFLITLEIKNKYEISNQEMLGILTHKYNFLFVSYKQGLKLHIQFSNYE